MILLELGRRTVLLLDVCPVLLIVVVALAIALGTEELAVAAKAAVDGILVTDIAPGQLLVDGRIAARRQLRLQGIGSGGQACLIHVLQKKWKI